MEHNTYVIILPADKGYAVVDMEHTEYNKKIVNIIQEVNYQGPKDHYWEKDTRRLQDQD